jgi:hypothetical protein
MDHLSKNEDLARYNHIKIGFLNVRGPTRDAKIS